MNKQEILQQIKNKRSYLCVGLLHPDKKGRGLAAMWMGLEFGLMIGAFGGMYIYGNDVKKFPLI